MGQIAGIAIGNAGNRKMGYMNVETQQDEHHHLKSSNRVEQDEFDKLVGKCMPLEDLRKNAILHVNELYGKV
ncbi:hypothetical protein FACS1894199_03820 [Bacteroidia bacterium]|nr:hypothetical protein FACS1894199_03820 [Bacteroidia bacterium]